MFGLTNTDWTSLKITSSEDKLSFFISDQLIKTIPISSTERKFVGCRFRFEGGGSVKDVRLDGKKVQ